MKKVTRGAWLIHHGGKLSNTTNQDFDNISFAAKCGTLLSAISAEGQVQLKPTKLEALAKANRISAKSEVPTILEELTRQRLISVGQTGAVEVLGLTGHTVLEHTATIFDESRPEKHESAVIELSEMASEIPLKETTAQELLSDQLQITRQVSADTIAIATQIGLIDSESISPRDKILFNGNLFRHDDAQKIDAVLSSLKPVERNLLIELNARLQSSGCISLEVATEIAGDALFRKLHSIGMFDVNVIGNEAGKSAFVTRPSAFSKFTNSFADDALDLAKAFVASLTYGMTIRAASQGRIQMISALVNKLIAGAEVGPATAIGNDYRALELRGVIRVRPAHGGMFTMKLLKPEVGRMALAVILSGDLSSEVIQHLPGAKVTEYSGPELSREIQRRDSTPAIKDSARKLLDEIRMGGL